MGNGGIAPPFSALDGGEWSASRLGHFIHEEIVRVTHWLGGWMDALKKKNLLLLLEIVQPVARRYTD
jgi:hypothetical protein